MIKKLKIKFVCINMLIVTVMLAVIFGMVLHITNQNMEEQGNRLLQSIHEDPLRHGIAAKDRRAPYFMVTVTPQGDVVLSSDTIFAYSRDSELMEIARMVYEKEERQGVLKEYNLRFSRKTTAWGEQIVFVDVTIEQGVLKDLIKTCAVICAVSYLVFFGISVYLAQWAIRPVEEAWKRQQQFIADASHELKTPLTVILTNAELLQEPGYDETKRTQFSQSIYVMSQQMRGLVEGLLNLARIDNGIVKTEFTEVDFSGIVSDGLLPFEPVYFEKGMELDSCIEEQIVVRGSGQHLQQMLDILLDNAGKYADSGSVIRIALKRQGGSCLLTVANSGEQISKDDLKNIFRRFYRIDKVRSMNQSYGLGLSIAQSIVTEHGGKIWAESQGGINSFHVQLPIWQHHLK